MPRKCTVCAHPDRDRVDEALVSPSQALRNVAQRFGLSPWALWRHLSAHIPEELAQAASARRVASAEELLSRLEHYLEEAEHFLLEAKARGDSQAGLRAIAEARKTCEVLLEVAGELDRSTQLRIALMPEWVELRTRILEALEPYPEARKAVMEALVEALG